MYFMPRESEVTRLMAELGLDYLQAVRHLQQRHLIQEAAKRDPQPYPLGKTQHYA